MHSQEMSYMYGAFISFPVTYTEFKVLVLARILLEYCQ